jgi:hypothetical protein
MTDKIIDNENTDLVGMSIGYAVRGGRTLLVIYSFSKSGTLTTLLGTEEARLIANNIMTTCDFIDKDNEDDRI